MKNSIIALLSILFFASTFSACKDESDLDLPYIFRPINFTAEINKTEVTFTWAPVDSAVTYQLQVSKDSLNFETLVLDTILNELTYKQEFEGKTTFFARIRANAADTIKNSKYNQIRFITPAENLFEGFKSTMTAWKTIVIKWRAAANVTALKLVADDLTSTTIQLNASEISAGEKTISELNNSNYAIEIYKNDILRGKVKVLVEGDIYVNTGDNIALAVANASEGQVLVLASGVVFPIDGPTLRFAKSIKLRGANSSTLPVLCMTSGTPTSTSNMLGFADGSVIKNVNFENIDFTGYCDNNNTATKIGYLFNNNLMTTVSNLSFNNCKLRNFGNTPFRLQANKSQVIDTLRLTNCTVNDIGFSSTYAIVNSNSADYINNIYFNNCTFYQFKGSLILRSITPPATATLGNVSIINCTINKGMQDAGSARYLLDFNSVNITNGITLRNTIIGSTGNAKGANGLRKLPEVLLNASGNYYTTDYTDDPIPTGITSTSIKTSMTAFSGTSSDLWIDPENSDFRLKANSFAGKGVAGDLRWY